MIYATDLDRTLIFSGKFLGDNPRASVVPVEYREDGKVISYMSTRVIKALKSARKCKNLKFVAVTTRSIAEVMRVQLPIEFDYIICANGGVILENGKVNRCFDECIYHQFEVNDLYKAVDFLKGLDIVTNNPRIVDDSYVFCKTNDEKQFNEIVKQWVLENDLRLYVVVQRGKCYLIPVAISKEYTLRWLSKYIGDNEVLAVGDSELDIPMLEVADYSYTQKHGALYKNGLVPFNVDVIPGGVTSPLYTIRLAVKLSKTI